VSAPQPDEPPKVALLILRDEGVDWNDARAGESPYSELGGAIEVRLTSAFPRPDRPK
jgi:hypothetical protein